ncbi:hypothetical protein C1H46_001428 [Malus baccata]|uniref:Uncharacterized protein n=1 Tax=Malus baccata TaxID=106549 RepID=A0A540NR15_MALBA|nr:hypothetical protein C1H46_001428 [Malus baccata]
MKMICEDVVISWELAIGQSQMALSNGLEVQKETVDAEIKSFFNYEFSGRFEVLHHWNIRPMSLLYLR